MSSAFNPYAPPQAEVDVVPDAGAGLQREGRLVRLAIGAEMPDRCIRCDGAAAGYRVSRTLYWRPGWWRVTIPVVLLVLFILGGLDPVIFAAFWLAVLGFGIGDIFVRRKIVVEYGLCERHRRLRSGVMGAFVASWVLLIGLVAAGTGGFHAVEHWWFWVLVLVMFALAITAGLLNRLRLARATPEHVWLLGAGRPFYERLPAAGG